MNIVRSKEVGSCACLCQGVIWPLPGVLLVGA